MCIRDSNRTSSCIVDLKLDENDILVSYDVTSLFTNVPVDETIELVTTKAFENDWFNKTYNLSRAQATTRDCFGEPIVPI